MKKNYPLEIVSWFRNAAPYIQRQRGNIFVVYVSGEAIADRARFPGLIADMALLHGLGVQLVLVHGARPQIEARLSAQDISLRYTDGFRVTSEEALVHVKETIATIRLDIETRLSMEPVDTSVASARGAGATGIRVASGNMVTGRPIGVRGGVDFGFTGEVRRIDVGAIKTLLAGGHMVLISPLGFSPAGDVLNLNAPDVAADVAAALPASKLLLLDGGRIAASRRLPIPSEITLSQASEHLTDTWKDESERGLYRHLARAVRVCRSGVPRAHLIDHRIDGALLLEVYTRDGAGIMVCSDSYDTLRRAGVDDTAGIIRLITPLEAEGVLVRRSREKIEADIRHFLVVERDGTVIACAAAYPCVAMSKEEKGTDLALATGTNHDQNGSTAMVELACLAVHPNYRNAECGNALLAAIEKEAIGQGASHLFALTTHAEHWFLERGFSRAASEDLPRTRQKRYNENRNAKVLIKAISAQS